LAGTRAGSPEFAETSCLQLLRVQRANATEPERTVGAAIAAIVIRLFRRHAVCARLWGTRSGGVLTGLDGRHAGDGRFSLPLDGLGSQTSPLNSFALEGLGTGRDFSSEQGGRILAVRATAAQRFRISLEIHNNRIYAHRSLNLKPPNPARVKLRVLHPPTPPSSAETGSADSSTNTTSQQESDFTHATGRSAAMKRSARRPLAKRTALLL